MIPRGTFAELLKQGVFFSLTSDDRVFTGDLHYDMAVKEFQLRGIPVYSGRMRSCFPAEDKGPYKIDLLVLEVIEARPRGEGSMYADMRFKKAKSSGEFAAWLEEWWGDRTTVMREVEESWQVTQDLTWYRE